MGGNGPFSGAVPHLLIVVGFMQLIFIRSDATIIDLTLNLSPKVLRGLCPVAFRFPPQRDGRILFIWDCRLVPRIMSWPPILTACYPRLDQPLSGYTAVPADEGVVRPTLVTTCCSALAFSVTCCRRCAAGLHSWIAFSFPRHFRGGRSDVSFFGGLTPEQRESFSRRISQGNYLDFKESDHETVEISP
jgi:hypothetical protein